MASLVYKHGSYHAVFKKHGKQQWIRIGNVDKKDARHVLKKLELEYAKDRLGITEIKPITLFAYIDEYMEYSHTNKAIGTYKKELSYLKPIKAFLGNVSLNKIDAHAVETYKAKRVNDGLKPKSVNRELELLRPMLNRAVEWQYLSAAPKIKLLKVPKTPPKFLTTDQMDRLIECASAWLKPMLIVLRNTGMRKGELLSLKFSDVDFDNKTVLVRASKTDDYRVLPMTQELHQTLLWLTGNYVDDKTLTISARQGHQMEYVFCHRDGSKIKDIKHSFKNACARADIKANPHLTRHSYASYLSMTGCDLKTLSECLGHSQISTTQRYTHCVPQHKTDAINRLPWAQPKLTLAK